MHFAIFSSVFVFLITFYKTALSAQVGGVYKAKSTRVPGELFINLEKAFPGSRIGERLLHPG